MANASTIQMVALDGFRRLYGTKARPEDMPRAWAAIVAEVRDELNEAMDDLRSASLDREIEDEGWR